MKKILALTLAGISISSFAATTTTLNQFDINKLECHCEKHKMIFDIKDGEKVSEMSKHCMINENKKTSEVKFVDDNSGKQVKCSVNNDKIQLKSCKEFNQGDKSSYTHSAKMTASEYTNTTSHN